MDDSLREFEQHPNKLFFFDVYNLEDIEVLVFNAIDEKEQVENFLEKLKHYQECLLKAQDAIKEESQRICRYLDRAAITYKEKNKNNPRNFGVREQNHLDKIHVAINGKPNHIGVKQFKVNEQPTQTKVINSIFENMKDIDATNIEKQRKVITREKARVQGRRDLKRQGSSDYSPKKLNYEQCQSLSQNNNYDKSVVFKNDTFHAAVGPGFGNRQAMSSDYRKNLINSVDLINPNALMHSTDGKINMNIGRLRPADSDIGRLRPADSEGNYKNLKKITNSILKGDNTTPPFINGDDINKAGHPYIRRASDHNKADDNLIISTRSVELKTQGQGV